MTTALTAFMGTQQIRPGDPINKTSLIPGARTAGKICIFEHDVLPYSLTTPHRHLNEDQVAYVLFGTIGYRVGDEEFLATKGSAVFRPRGVFHTNFNPTGERARMLEITVNSTIEEYAAQKQALVDAGKGSPDAIARLRNRYGIEINLEWIAEMEQRLSIKWPENEIF